MSSDPVHFDTSVVMRFLMAMPILQFRSASRYLISKRAAGGHAKVSDLVLVEAYFALQHFYGLHKAEALAALAGFSQLPGIAVSDHALSVLRQPKLASSKPGFADRLIHGCAQAADQTLVTFEKAASKLPGTLVLEG
jgi:predicted nucleic-acid-binding protein